MKNSKETRTCIGCKNKNNKNNLIRIMYTKDQTIALDLNQKAGGRGMYICKNQLCLDKALKNKTLKLNIDNENLEKLRGVMLG